MSSSNKFLGAVNLQKWLGDSNSLPSKSSFKLYKVLLFSSKNLLHISFLLSKILKNGLATRIAHSHNHMISSLRKATFVYIRFHNRKIWLAHQKRCWNLIGQFYQSLNLTGQFYQSSNLIGQFYQSLNLIGQFYQSLNLIGQFYQSETWLVNFISP
jgi:hypothetical protein